jgi:hypothetical protein
MRPKPVAEGVLVTVHSVDTSAWKVKVLLEELLDLGAWNRTWQGNLLH